VVGAPCGIRALDRPYGLIAWPWTSTSVASAPGPATLLDLRTGQIRAVDAEPRGDIPTCGAAWCRISTTVDDEGNARRDIQGIAGDQRRRLGQDGHYPLNVAVPLLDRFEVLGSSVAVTGTATTRLWLHDLDQDRTVLMADGISGAVGRRRIPVVGRRPGRNARLAGPRPRHPQ
jgi:hypothetical protein